jgi:hypothetical protein
MRINANIIYIFLGAILSLQGWMLKEIVFLKERVAAITAVMGLTLFMILGAGCSTNPATGKAEFLKPSQWLITDASGTNVVTAPQVGESIATASQIGGILPSPANQIVTGVSALIAASLGIVARYKSARLVNARALLEQSENQLITERTKLEATIKGVEEFSEILGSGTTYAGTPDKLVKAKIQERANALGVAKSLYQDVKSLT